MARSCSTVPTNVCSSYPNAMCVVYTGSNLLCTGIKTNDRLDTILQKIETKICEGGGGGGSTFIEAGYGIDLDGVGTSGNPYVISNTLLFNNALTTNNLTTHWGQTVGRPDNAGALLFNTEIPMGDFYILFNNNTGIGPDNLCSIKLSANNFTGSSLSDISIQADDVASVSFISTGVDSLSALYFTGPSSTYRGWAGYSSTENRYTVFDMLGLTDSVNLSVGGDSSQTWSVDGSIILGQFGTKNTGFGGQTSPTAFIDIAASTISKGSERTRAGVTPSSGYLDGLRWYDGTHYYMRIGGIDKQLDNDYNFTPDDFIQNQFLSAQNLANFWIDGHGRIDDYLQLGGGGRIESYDADTNALALRSNIDPAPGQDRVSASLRLIKLNFFTIAPGPSSTPPYTEGGTYPSGASIYSFQADQLNLHTPYIATGDGTGFDSFVFDTSTIYVGNGVNSPVMSTGGLHPLIIAGESGSSGNYDILKIRNNDYAPSSPTDSGAEAYLTYEHFTDDGSVVLGVHKGTRKETGSIGTILTDYLTASFQGDLVFKTADATINSGELTEYFRITHDGELIASRYSTLLSPPTTNGTTKMLINDEDGLFSWTDIPTGLGSVTSVGLSMPSAFSVSSSPITGSGTITVTGAGTTSQYIRGDGSLATHAIPLSSITAATTSNSIDNTSFAQTWSWDSISASGGLIISSNTSAPGNGSTLFSVARTGSLASSGITTFGAVISNLSNGTNAVSHGLYLASAGSTAYDLWASTGKIQLGTFGVGSKPGVIKMRTGQTTGSITLQATSVLGSTVDRVWTLPNTTGSANDALIISSVSGSTLTLGWGQPTSTRPLSSISAGTATNTIDSTLFAQTWGWSTLAGQTAFTFNSASTAGASGQTLLKSTLSGAHAASGVDSYSIYASNTHTGTSSTNVAVYATASGGSTNRAIQVNAGDIYVNSFNTITTQDYIVGYDSSGKLLGKVVIGSGLDITNGILSNTDVPTAQTFQEVLTTGSTLVGNNTVDVDGNNFVWINAVDYSIESTGDFTLSNTGATSTFFKIANYGAASNGDVLTLIDNATGQVGWSSGSAGGGVTSFSAGNLSPLFTSNVATATTTPALTFTLSNAAGHTYFGNDTGGSTTPSFISNAAFVRVNDTNVTATLTGSPTTALLETMTLTLGWTGQLAVARGGTGIASFTAGDIIRATGATTLAALAIGTAGQVLTVNGGGTDVQWSTPTTGTVTSFSAGDLSPLFTTTESTVTTTPALSFTLTNAGGNTYFGNSSSSTGAPSYVAAAALTTGSDTNIVLTAGGNSGTSLLRSASITASWSGVLSVARGGTNIASYTAGDILRATGTTTLTKLALGTPNQQLRVNAGGTDIEWATIANGVTTLNTLTAATQTFATGTSGIDFNISSSVSTHTFNIPDASLAARGLVTTGAQSFEGVKTHNVGTIVNESGANSASGGDFRVESDTNANAIFVDSTNNRIGLFTGSPTVPIEIVGNTYISSGSLAVAASPTTAAPLTLGGSGWTSSGIILLPSISSTAGSSPSIIGVTGTIIEASSGTHPIISGINVTAPTITSGLATVTNTASLYISGAPSATVTGSNNALYIAGGTLRTLGDVVVAQNVYSSGGYDLTVRNQSTGRLETVDPDIVVANTQSGVSYTLVLSDKGKVIERTNASAQTVTIPTNASVAFPIGTVILVEQTGAGQVTFTPAVGVTLNSADSATKTRVQWVTATLRKSATNTWSLSGDITT